MACLHYIAIVVWMQLTVAHVAPPTDVILHCKNFSNILTWTYENISEDLSFRVNIRSTLREQGVLWVNDSSLQADMSLFTSPIPREEFFLTINAVRGHQESKRSKGVAFSYFKNTVDVDQICSLDFPPVNVSVGPENKILISFTHPCLFHHKNLPAWLNPRPRMVRRHDTEVLEDLPAFDFEVLIINQTKAGPFPYTCEESVCELHLPVDVYQETYCVEMRQGVLQNVIVKATENYCSLPLTKPLPEKKDDTYIYVGIGLTAAVAFVVILYMLYRYNTNSPTSLPSSVLTAQVRQWATPRTNQRDPMIVPQVEPSSPVALLSEKEKEMDESTLADIPKYDYDVRRPIGVSTDTDEGVSDVGQRDEYMSGNNLEVDDIDDDNNDDNEAPYENHSSYERRECVVELGPGEEAQGYRG